MPRPMVECRRRREKSGRVEKVVSSAFRVPKDGEMGAESCASSEFRDAHQFVKSCASSGSEMRISSPSHAHLQVQRCASICKLLAGLESLSGIQDGLSSLENFYFRLSCVNFLPFIGLVRQLGRMRAPESAWGRCREEGRDAAVLPRTASLERVSFPKARQNAISI